MSDIKTKYTFYGNPKCGACSGKSGEYDYDPGKGHPNCACTISIQSTRVKCTAEDTTELYRELINTHHETELLPERSIVRIRTTKTYDVSAWVLLDCVRVDAGTGNELGDHWTEVDEVNFTDNVVGEWEEYPSDELESILPELVPPPN